MQEGFFTFGSGSCGGRIEDFEVLVRPFKGLTALAEAMQKRLAAAGVAG